MFSVVSKISYLIGCNKRVLRGKEGKIIYPSQLTDKWFLNTFSAELTAYGVIKRNANTIYNFLKFIHAIYLIFSNIK